MPVPWQHAIIVGASSGIGAELTRQLADGGCRTALVARRAPELERLVHEIAARGGAEARAYVHDVTHTDQVPTLFQTICRELGGLDLIVFAAGIMPRLTADEYDFAKDRATIEVNVLGAVAWLNQAAMRFARAGVGTIVGISSVAGDRGRRGYPVYNASKAALTTYLEALRNRLAPCGVHVVTIKPGPVATPMTDGLANTPFLIPAERAAREILVAARRGRATAYTPALWRPIMGVIRALPSAIMRRLPL